MIEIDDLRPDRTTSQTYICHVNSAGIFPVQWSLKNGLHLSPPPGMFVQACCACASWKEVECQSPECDV